MKLYGTTTSPYVRRVRAVALELGVDFELVDTFTDAGQALLRTKTPLWKVPTAEIDGHVMWDSSAIIDYLVATRGHGPLRPVRDTVRESNLRFAIDGALDAAINVFYLEREGVLPSVVPYQQKQNGRIEASLAYIAESLREGYLTDEKRVGVGEIALATTLEWFVFRKRFPIETIAPLDAAMRMFAERPSLAATRPG